MDAGEVVRERERYHRWSDEGRQDIRLDDYGVWNGNGNSESKGVLLCRIR